MNNDLQTDPSAEPALSEFRSEQGMKDSPVLSEEGVKDSQFLCPECDAGALHRSRYRGVMERARRRVSEKRPYRCWACDWRGWLVPPPQPTTFAVAADAVPRPPDLDAIDLTGPTTSATDARE